jgi:hypothetical protein
MISGDPVVERLSRRDLDPLVRRLRETNYVHICQTLGVDRRTADFNSRAPELSSSVPEYVR